MTDSRRQRAVETLAQQLYEESEPGATPWARRGRTIREPWLARARRILEKDDAP